MRTTDISSITNSVLQAMEKEFRKNGMGGAFHRNYVKNRAMVQGLVALTVGDHLSESENNQFTTLIEQLITVGRVLPN